MEAYFTAPVLALCASCILMFGLGFLVTLQDAARAVFFSLPALVQKAYVALFMAPMVAMPLVPQVRYDVAETASTATGALLLVLALGLWTSALRAMRGIPSMRQATGLVTAGVYGLVRNPLYTANSLVLPGLGFLTQSLPALLFAPVVIGLFFVQSLLEERELSAEYGEAYAAYRERVRYRLFPFVL